MTGSENSKNKDYYKNKSGEKDYSQKERDLENGFDKDDFSKEGGTQGKYDKMGNFASRANTGKNSKQG